MTSPTLSTSPRALQVRRDDPGLLGVVRTALLRVHRTLSGGRPAPSWLRKLPTFDVTDHLGVVSRLNLTSELSELLHDAVREVSELQDDVEKAANAASTVWNGATPVQLHTDEVGAKILRSVFRRLFKPQTGWAWRTDEPEGPPRRAFTAPPNVTLLFVVVKAAFPASTMAPASRRRSPVSGSEVTAAVRPTPEEPRPVVLTATGAMLRTKRRSWDLAVEGSPTMHTFRSPRSLMPSGVRLCTPPMSMSSRQIGTPSTAPASSSLSPALRRP